MEFGASNAKVMLYINREHIHYTDKMYNYKSVCKKKTKKNMNIDVKIEIHTL